MNTRPADLELARLHLRTGSTAIARAELEAMAVTAELDDEGLLDLAEARWRSGNLEAAGTAADMLLASGRSDPLALVIAAEARAAAGRPGEARRLAAMARQAAPDDIDALFAGEPRSAVWPHDPADPGEPAGELFPPVGVPADRRSRPAAERLWPDERGVTEPAGADSLVAGRAALSTGDVASAALALTLALRLSPTLAGAVLDAIVGVSDPSLEIVRGDAYRLLGQEAEARRAYAAARVALGVPRSGDGPPLPSEVPVETRPVDTTTDMPTLIDSVEEP